MHRRALAHLFGCTRISDNWAPSEGLGDDTLHLTQHIPGGESLPYDKDGLRAYHFDDAMHKLNESIRTIVE